MGSIAERIGALKSSWTRRQIAIAAPYVALGDLARLDGLLNSQVDALHWKCAQSWAAVEQRLSGSEYSLHDLFPAAVLAFSEDAPAGWRGFLLELIGPDEPSIGALVEALAWLPLDSIKEHLLQLLASRDTLHQRIALAVCAYRRVDVGDYLTAALQSDAPEHRTCALKAAGELGRGDLLDSLRQHLTTESPDWRFTAVCSAVRLGERGPCLERLIEIAGSDCALRKQAISLLPRVLNATQRAGWLDRIKDQSIASPDAIIGIGAAGDPWQIPWLLTLMQDCAVARAAGEAFTLITGLDLVEHGFAQPAAAPPAEPLDPKRGLPWPDPEAIGAWWHANLGHYKRGTRYLLGHPITPDHCRNVLITGYQRQRGAAALELGLIQTGMPLFAVHAPVSEQRDLLDIADTLQLGVETTVALWPGGAPGDP